MWRGGGGEVVGRGDEEDSRGGFREDGIGFSGFYYLFLYLFIFYIYLFFIFIYCFE